MITLAAHLECSLIPFFSAKDLEAGDASQGLEKFGIRLVHVSLQLNDTFAEFEQDNCQSGFGGI